jgi:ATP-binding cassette subfamily B (MDR/TAP) protein 1
MSFPKGNLEGIQRHYSVHNLSHEIPKNDIEEEEEKKSKLQNTIHSPTEKNLRQTEADLLSQTNSQKKSLNPNEIELQEKEEDIKIENTLMFEQKNISVPKLYCHLSKQTEKILLFFGIIGSLGSGVSGPLMTQLFGGTIDDASSSQDINPALMSEIELDEFFDVFQNNIDKMSKKFIYIGIGMFFANFLANFCWTYAGLRMVFHLKENYFSIILKQEQGWFDENNAYEFATKVQAQIEQVDLGVGDKLGTILQCIAQLITGLIIAFITSWKLTLVMLSVSPCIIGAVCYLITALKNSIVLGRKTYEKAGGVAEEMLYNIKTVASFANFDFENKRFGQYIDKCHSLDREKAIKLGGSIGVIIFFLNFTFFIAVLYGKKLIVDGMGKNNRLTAGDVMTVIFSTLMAIMSIGGIAPNLKSIQEACTASSDYFTLYERKPAIDTSHSTFKPPRDQVQGKIEFKDITFIYPSDVNQRKILEGLNLVIEPGQKVALVGESGCGKSTTINLIERLYEATEGKVLIDGRDIKEYDLEYLRNLIGYVQQEPVLFNTSIRDNLFFGRNEYVKTLGDPESLMKEACADAYAKEFIEMKQEKYDYVVGIKGGKLSGGQKQRLAIARAILCKPKILILDEATSALDNKSEKEVQAALDHISEKSVTTVIIAHRLSTIKNADVIYALKGGKVYEKGTHKELLEKNGYYASLVKSQLAQDELESKEENISPMQKKMSKMSSERKMTLQRMSRKSSRYSSNLDTNTQLKEIEKEKEIKIERGRIFSLISDHKGETFIGALGAFIGGAISPVQGFVMSKAINALSSTNPKTVKDDGLLWGLMFLVVAFVNGISLFFKIWKLETIGSVITSKMRKLIIDKYLHLHIGFFDEDENAPGSLLTRLSIDTTQLNTLVLSVVGDLVGTLGTAAVGLGLSFYFSWRLTLISICFLPFIVYAQIIIAKTRRGGREEDKKIDIEAGGVLSECVINTKTIYSFNFQKPAVNMYLQILYEAEKKFFKDSFIKGIVCGLGVFAMYASNATVFHFSGVFIRKGKLSFQDMNSAMNCVMTMSQGISQGLVGVSEYTKAKKAFSSVFSTMDTKTLIDPSEEGNKGKITPENLKGKIEFKNVTFAYPTRPDQKILRDISLTIPEGHSAALVGYSGCGKSTIIQLIERYYDADKGEVLIDGINIKDYNLYQLRKKIGLVSQEPVLFKRSVYENILYGKLTANRDEVFTAAKRAVIEKFFNKDSMGTKEDPVSGGEKQRLAIARAFLKDPVILLLDEATSALDKESEIEVQKSIDELQKGRTSVAVAHRLSTIVDSDIIFVLENGKIVEKGNHKELLALGQKYATLYKYSNTT